MLRYAITPGTLDLREISQFVEKCAALAEAGIEFILIREKHLAAGALAELSRRVIGAARGTATRVLVARRLDVALAVGADGVHLAGSPGELTPPQVRALMPDAFVTVSCHSLEEVGRARAAGASAVLFGPVFGKTVGGAEVVAGIGLARLAEACDAAGTVPVFALGGVASANAAECMAAGASGVAGIRMFL